MSIFKKIIFAIKNVFTKQNDVKRIEMSNEIASVNGIDQNTGNNFMQSLKNATNSVAKKKKVETLICDGDGLGIQKKISY